MDHDMSTQYTTGPIPMVTLPDLPEARCSVNAFVEIGPLKCQITGRGDDGQEAADNFTSTLNAMRNLHAAPPAPACPSLGEIVTKWLDRAARTNDQALGERICKGVVLYLGGHVSRMADQDDDQDVIPRHGSIQYTVRAQRGNDSYVVAIDPEQVHSHSCTCKDFTTRAIDDAPYFCKHLAAAILHRKLTQ